MLRGNGHTNQTTEKRVRCMYKKKSVGVLNYFDFILLDMLCLQIALIAAHAASGYGFNPYESLQYRRMAVVIEVINFVVLCLSFDALKGILKRGRYREFVATIKHDVIVGLLFILWLFILKETTMYSRLVISLTIVFYVLISYTVRLLWREFLRRRMTNGGDCSLLVVTTVDIAESVINNIRENNYEMYKIVGIAVVDADIKGQIIAGVKVVADINTVPSYVCREWIDEVLIIPSKKISGMNDLKNKLIETGVTVHERLCNATSDVYGKKQLVENLGNYTVLTTSINVATSRQLIIKRAMDIVVGLIGCIATGIIFIFVAPAIFISSPGPIFFAQERVGKNGKRFKMYKFRSMYPDAEKRKAELKKENKIEDGRMFKLDFDPRVIGNKILPDGTKKTGIGNFIRATSLDEFPQFFNVLKGDMSVVGTRPPLPGEVSEYELHHRARLAVKPGITGMWQVSGRSNITNFEDVVKLDKEYISKWNIGLDIKIMIKTFFVVLKKEGSV